MTWTKMVSMNLTEKSFGKTCGNSDSCAGYILHLHKNCSMKTLLHWRRNNLMLYFLHYFTVEQIRRNFLTSNGVCFSLQNRSNLVAAALFVAYDYHVVCYYGQIVRRGERIARIVLSTPFPKWLFSTVQIPYNFPHAPLQDFFSCKNDQVGAEQWQFKFRLFIPWKKSLGKNMKQSLGKIPSKIPWKNSMKKPLKKSLFRTLLNIVCLLCYKVQKT